MQTKVTKGWRLKTPEEFDAEFSESKLKSCGFTADHISQIRKVLGLNIPHSENHNYNGKFAACSSATSFAGVLIFDSFILPADKEEEAALLGEIKRLAIIEADFVQKSTTGGYHFVFKVRDSKQQDMGTYEFYAYSSPTGNCQVGSLAYFNNILMQQNYVDLLTVVRGKLSQTIGKRLYLFDVHHNYKDKLEGLEIYGMFPYRSTNGSQMITGLIKI